MLIIAVINYKFILMLIRQSINISIQIVTMLEPHVSSLVQSDPGDPQGTVSHLKTRWEQLANSSSRKHGEFSLMDCLYYVPVMLFLALVDFCKPFFARNVV